MLKTRSARLAAALLAGAVALGGPLAPERAQAEDKTYGAVYLSGPAQKDWNLNPRGEVYAMVCNVNGPDGWLAIREFPDSKAKPVRKLKRLALLLIDNRDVRGKWVKVVDAFRQHTPEGKKLAKGKHFKIKGWAHLDYLCDFID